MPSFERRFLHVAIAAITLSSASACAVQVTGDVAPDDAAPVATDGGTGGTGDTGDTGDTGGTRGSGIGGQGGASDGGGAGPYADGPILGAPEPCLSNPNAAPGEAEWALCFTAAKLTVAAGAQGGAQIAIYDNTTLSSGVASVDATGTIGARRTLLPPSTSGLVGELVGFAAMPSGGVAVTGFSYDAPGFGGLPAPTHTDSSVSAWGFVSVLDGNLGDVWARSLGVCVVTIAPGAAASVFVGGYCYAGGDLGDGPLLHDASVVAKYDATGALLWTWKKANGEQVSAISPSTDGDVWITTTGPGADPFSPKLTLRRFDDVGKVVVDVALGVTESDCTTQLAPAPDGGVYASFPHDWGVNLVRLDASGSPLWTQRAEGQTNDVGYPLDKSTSLSADAAGNVVVALDMAGPTHGLGFDLDFEADVGVRFSGISKVDASGTVQWSATKSVAYGYEEGSSLGSAPVDGHVYLGSNHQEYDGDTLERFAP